MDIKPKREIELNPAEEPVPTAIPLPAPVPVEPLRAPVEVPA
jgi:hypothetical protein